MDPSAPYVTPQERRRQKAIERQLPSFRPAPVREPATGEIEAIRRDAGSPGARPTTR